MTSITKIIIFLAFFSALIALSMAEIPKPVPTKPILHRKVDISYLRYLDRKIKDTLYTTKIKYPLSLEKIVRMYNNLVQNGFTSFAEA